MTVVSIDLALQVSDIPYASKFGGAGNVDMKLSEYIDEVRIVERQVTSVV